MRILPSDNYATHRNGALYPIILFAGLLSSRSVYDKFHRTLFRSTDRLKSADNDHHNVLPTSPLPFRLQPPNIRSPVHPRSPSTMAPHQLNPRRLKSSNPLLAPPSLPPRPHSQRLRTRHRPNHPKPRPHDPQNLDRYGRPRHSRTMGGGNLHGRDWDLHKSQSAGEFRGRGHLLEIFVCRSCAGGGAGVYSWEAEGWGVERHWTEGNFPCTGDAYEDSA